MTDTFEPPRRLADDLAISAGLVGRAAEGAHLERLLADPNTVVVFVHGTGGVGKTTLVAGVLERRPASQLALDARHVEPTADGVLAAMSDRLGTPCRTPDQVGDAMAESRIATLVIDSYERFVVADGWLRNELLPALPADTTTILVSRNPPNVAWRTAPGWRHRIAELVVGPLTHSDAAELVARHGLSPTLSSRVLDFARGHPLALELAAEAFRRHPDLQLPEGPPPEAVEELVDVLFDDLDPEIRTVVECSCVLRRVIQPLLAAVLAGHTTRSIDDAWKAMRDLPFVRVQAWGLELQPVVQEVAAASLELREPGRTRQLRRQAAAAAFAEIQRAPGWDATADLLHLVQNPVIRRAFAPPPGLEHPVEIARPDDATEIDLLVARTDGDQTAQILRRWWAAHPEAFSVLRGPTGRVAAMSVALPLDQIDPELDAFDPVMERLREHARQRPLARGGRCLVIRRALAATTGEHLSPSLAPVLIDLKRTYLALRPSLERIYSTVVDWAGAGTTTRAMGFEACTEAVRVGETTVQLCALELGPGSVDGWLARQVEAESATPSLDPHVTGAPSGEDALAALSARELEVLTALAEGLTNRQLAERLFISERTANRHISNIFTKLGVHTRTAAARVAIEAGLAS
jgi:DNA-binding CsgD family transcriptional regulator